MRWYAWTTLGLSILGCGGGGGAGGSGGAGGGGAGGAPASPILLETVPFDMGAVDWATVTSHRATFADIAPHFPIVEFGESDGLGNDSVQVIYYVPDGTVARAPVSGRVAAVPTLYSGDFSVQIGDFTKPADGVWEVEHVLSPMVAEGDMVVAGQPVGIASNHACTSGNQAYCDAMISTIELGVLIGGATPTHDCPYSDRWIAPDASASVFADLDAMHAAISAAAGDPNYFGTATWESHGCVLDHPVSE